MNVAMPYRPFHSQSRVEFIKKKFESTFSQEESDKELLKRTNVNAPCKSNFLKEIKDLKAEKKLDNSKIGSIKNTHTSKNEGKALVKRSPAFRREKLGCTKSLTQISSQESLTLKQTESNNNKECIQKETLTSDENNVNLWNDFKRSKTDTNLLKYCSSKNKEVKEFSKELKKNSKGTEISNSLVFRQAEVQVDKKNLPEYSFVNKEKCSPLLTKRNTHRNEATPLKFSESIRRALQSPLPKGPPPKKPPRTFCHIPHFTQTDLLVNKTIALPISTKADIPKLKSKLEKLEKVIKIHETGNQADKVRDNFEKQVNKISKAADVTETCQSCLPISNCLTQGTKVQSLKKLLKSKSEFNLEIDRPDLQALKCFGENKNSQLGSTSETASVKVFSAEAIYDMPCVNKKNSFETFGKCSKDLKESVNSIKAESLHYMCTDVINQASKQQSFLSKSVEAENENRSFDSKLKFMASLQKEKSSSMSRIDNVKELENHLKIEKVDDKTETLVEWNESSAELEKDSEKSNSDLILPSDGSKGRSTRETEEHLTQMSARRKIYVSRVSSKLINQVPWKYKSKNTYKHLFECCLLVGLTLCDSKQNMPYIKSVFPPDTKPPPLIEALCFPDASYWPPTSENNYPEEQYYSLVVTNESGERKFGYCRRVLPEGGSVCLPLAYCIVSPHRAVGFFNKVLEELESRHGSPGLDKFIKQLYESEFPGPGERLKLKEILEEATRTSHLDCNLSLSSTLVRRPPDVRLEEKDLTQLFKHLQLSVFLKIFGSLLHERKVLLLSSSLRSLSSSIEALQSILLPFSWQHTYIPVLPVHLIEMCEAPTPYVMGLLKPRNVEKSLTDLNFEDGILVDLDESKILKCCGDEASILPPRFTRDLKTALNLAMSATDVFSESVRSVLISDAFIRFFVQVCGNYSKFIETLPNGSKIFQKDLFVRSATSSATQSFLDWFVETAMFNSFIQERLQGGNEDVLVKLFRRRAMEYSDERIKDSAILLKNYRVINKKVRTLGDKIKDFTSFNK